MVQKRAKLTEQRAYWSVLFKYAFVLLVSQVPAYVIAELASSKTVDVVVDLEARF
jgi:ABC-type microcin C transport system permease subunit YejB